VLYWMGFCGLNIILLGSGGIPGDNIIVLVSCLHYYRTWCFEVLVRR
jgi:hypothetical protein